MSTGAHDILVDGPAFWAALRQDIADAVDSVSIQTLTFEGDATGLSLADAMIACRAPRRRILVDSFNLYFQSDRFVYKPSNMRAASPVRAEAKATREMIERLRDHGVEVKYTNPVGMLMRRMLARDHKKIVLLDGCVAYLGGINFCDHNFASHDMMVRMDHREIAQALTRDFEATWRGERSAATVRCGDTEVLNLDGTNNERVCRKVLSAIDGARREIQVVSPYMTFPFTDALRHAVRRGVRVTVIVPAANNRGFLTAYMRAEAVRSGFDLRLYDGMTHLKGMLIDDARLVFGSSNFDWLTYHLLGEVMAITTNTDLISQFRSRVLAPDLAMSATPDTGIAFSATALDTAFRAAAVLGQLLCKPAKRPVGAVAAPAAVPIGISAPSAIGLPQ